MLAAALITKSFYLSTIVGYELETVGGSESSIGLSVLNDILDEASADASRLPLYTHTVQPTTSGVAEYTFDNLETVEDVQYQIQSVLFPSTRIPRSAYYGGGRILNVSALPYAFYSERLVDTMKVILYFPPTAQVDNIIVTGRTSFGVVTEDTELLTVMPKSYEKWMLYELASCLCHYYDLPFSEAKEKKRKDLKAQITNFNPLDYTGKKISTFAFRLYDDYGQANLGKGWTPA